MKLSIRDKADAVATFRFVSVQLMETLARWVPITPELEAKTLFGRHIWDLAQHADQLGKRTVELRAALHYNRAPLPAYSAALATFASAATSVERITTFYDIVLPDLERRYRVYIDASDRLLDDPTLRIMDRIVTDLARMRADRDDAVGARADLKSHRGDSRNSLQATLDSVEEWVDYRPPQAPALEVL